MFAQTSFLASPILMAALIAAQFLAAAEAQGKGRSRWSRAGGRSASLIRESAHRGQVKPVAMRFGGYGRWSLARVELVKKFFRRSFGRSLPISAYGQSKFHTQVGFDHRHAVDIAVHPESFEGRKLLKFLSDSGFPYIAFRRAWPGAATAAHVHLGKPSRKLYPAVAGR